MNNRQFETFGCRLNAYETQAMDELSAGLDNVIVINTCAVTKEAVRQGRQRIRKLRAEYPDAKMIVTGCAAQIDPTSFSQMDEVDLVLGNLEKMQSGTWDNLKIPDLTGKTEPVQVNDIMSATETAGHLIDGFGTRARAYVQVQNGCDHRCTFCIIPYGRGNSRSVPAGVVVDQIKRLVARGFNEIVLTGVDMTSWGSDLPGTPPLGDLVQRILKLVPDLPRLRISSIDSIEADDALLDAFESDHRFMPHLHLSLQAGDNMILKRMKRRHSRDDAIAFCQDVKKRRADVVFGADIIAGFPTETDEMFENSMHLIEECDLTWLHVFPYSAREGTPAARMPQLPKTLRKERAKRLRVAGNARIAAHMQAQRGKRHSVLMESPRMGRTEGFAPVHFDTDQEVGAIKDVQITGSTADHLIAET
jgi:threonylcarbamoyladenosine tRNA methylthiotransferase MtaB